MDTSNAGYDLVTVTLGVAVAKGKVLYQAHGASASAISTIHLMGKNGQDIIGRACDENTAKANVKAIFNAMNKVYV